MMRIYVRKRGKCKPETVRVAVGGGSGRPFRALLRHTDLPLILQCLFGLCLRSAPSSRSQHSRIYLQDLFVARGVSSRLCSHATDPPYLLFALHVGLRFKFRVISWSDE